MRANSSHYVKKVSCPEGALRKVFIVVVDDKRFTASCPVGAAGPSTATDLVTRSGAAPDVLARRTPLALASLSDRPQSSTSSLWQDSGHGRR